MPDESLMVEAIFPDLHLQTHALTMCEVLDATHRPTISCELVGSAIAKAKTRRCPDFQGLVVEAIKALPTSAVKQLAGLFNDRAVVATWRDEQSAPVEEEEENHCSQHVDIWRHLECTLIPKDNIAGIIKVQNFCPNGILSRILKIYLSCLLLLLKPFLAITSYVQYAAGEFHQCLEVNFICRMLIEKANFWGFSSSEVLKKEAKEPRKPRKPRKSRKQRSPA